MLAIQFQNINLKTFNNVLNECRGDVYMVTINGDRLNLKSKLCQLIGFSRILSDETITQAMLECSDPEDEQRLSAFDSFCKA